VSRVQGARAAAAVLLLSGATAACSAGTSEASSAVASATASSSALAELETFDDLSTEHVEGSVDYEQSPPVGGAHLARWLACDVYDEPVPAEAAVHSMEHGAVWVTYRPGLPADDVAALAELASVDEEYVLVSPFEDLPAPVVASSWGVQLQADGADDPRLRAFVEAFAGGDQGGEPGAPCRTGGVSPQQAAELIGG